MSEGFVAACERCGAAVAFVLGAPRHPCHHCGAPDPLPADVRARLDAAARLVHQVAAREQIALLTRADELGSTAWMVPALAVPVWAIFGWMAYSMVSDSIPPDGALALLGAKVDGGDAVSAWWVLFFLATGITGSLAGYLLGLWRMLRRPEPPRAVAPLAPGAPPRCHVCGGGLPTGGVRRSCGYCGAANLVDDRAFRSQAAHLVEQLRRAEAQELGRLAVVGKGLARLMYVSAAFPFVVLFAAPFTLFASTTAPGLLVIPGVLAALAALFLLLCLVHRGPPVPSIRSSKPGDLVRVRGVAHVVVGVSSEHSPPRRLLAPEGSSTPTLAIDAYANQGQLHVSADTRSADGGWQRTRVGGEDLVVVPRG